MGAEFSPPGIARTLRLLNSGGIRRGLPKVTAREAFSPVIVGVFALALTCGAQSQTTPRLPEPPVLDSSDSSPVTSSCETPFAQPEFKRGWNLTEFNVANSDIPADEITALAIAANRDVWVGGYNSVARFNDKGWMELRVWSDPTRSYRGIVDVVVDRSNVAWVGGGDGVAQYRGKHESNPWTYHTHRSGALPFGIVMDLALDEQDRVWIATTGGIVVRENNEWRTIGRPTTNNLLALSPGPVPRSIFALTLHGPSEQAIYLYSDRHWSGPLIRQNESWARYGGVFDLAFLPQAQTLYVKTKGRVLAFKGECLTGSAPCNLSQGKALKVYSTSRFTLAPDRYLWFADQGRVYRTAGGEPQHVLGLNEYISHIAPSADQTLWLGTDRGVIRAAPGLVSTLMLPTNWATHASTMQRTRDGALWIGFNGLATRDSGGRVGMVRFLDGVWTCFDKTNSALPSERITSLFESPNGDLWVGTAEGVLQKSRSSERVWTAQDGVLPGNFIWGISGDSDATWIATSGGLARMDQKTGVWSNPQTLNAGFARPLALEWHLHVDAHGDLLVGDSSKLSRVRQEATGKVSITHVHDGYVKALSVGASGRAYAAMGAHLYVLNAQQPRLVDGWLEVPSAWGDQRFMCEDEQGALWAIGTRERSGESGLFRYPLNDPMQHFSWQALAIRPGRLMGVVCEADSVLILELNRLHRVFPPRAAPKLKLIGIPETTRDPSVHVSAVPFDPAFLTTNEQFRFDWVLKREPIFGPSKSLDRGHNRSGLIELRLPSAGKYTLSVTATDRFGRVSERQSRTFEFAEDSLKRRAGIALKVIGGSGVLYLLALPPLIWLASRYSWARVAITSGLFTKFPILHRLIVNSRWARFQLLRRYALNARLEIPDNYMEQVARATVTPDDSAVTLITPRDVGSGAHALPKRVLLIGRSGTGKSVYLLKACSIALEQFLAHRSAAIPVLIDLRTHRADRDIHSLVCDLLEGGGAGIPRDALQFMMEQGPFIILIDSLNESRDDKAAIEHVHQFMHADHANTIVVASQRDMLSRPDVKVFELLPPDADELRDYLLKECGRDVWSELPPAARDLATTPQDIALIAETVRHSEDVPLHRGDLYAELASRDTALVELSRTDQRGLAIIYAVAFRMIRTRQLAIESEQLEQWLEELGREAKPAVSNAIRQSRAFREIRNISQIGIERPVIGFAHELLGKYFAAEHIARDMVAIRRDSEELHALCADERWRDSLVFAVDRLSRTEHLEWYVNVLIRSSRMGLQVAAYALEFHGSRISDSVRRSYTDAEISTSARAALRR